jgi:K+/H+ antiporter YhaU regulatory subunit KhtT
VEKLTDIIVETRARIETIEINEEDRKACELVIYLMATIRANRSSPLEAMRVAAEALFLETKPYVGCQRLPKGQKLVMIRALLTDLTTEGMYAHVQTLHLADVVEELGVVAGRLGDLISQRTSQRAAERTEPAKVVRAEMDEQFDDILTIAFVTSVAHPSPEATRFVSLMNAVIAESETAYKQRTVQRTRRKKE